MQQHVAILVLATCVAACGGAAHPSVSARQAAIDQCLVGRWRSTGVSGTIVVGGASVLLSGAGGEVLTIGTEGAALVDDTHAQALNGTAPDGTEYRLVQVGRGTATITSSANRIGVGLADPAALTVMLYRNNILLQTTHPAAATDTYTCRAHSALVIAGAGSTVTTYAAA